MIIHKKMSTLVLFLIVGILINGITFLVPRQILFARILFPIVFLWLIFYLFTNSLKIDEKGVWVIYAFFQKKLWISKLIEWGNIDSVTFVVGPKSIFKDNILITPKNKYETLWSNNLIGFNTEQFDFQIIVPLLLGHGVTLPQDLIDEYG